MVILSLISSIILPFSKLCSLHAPYLFLIFVFSGKILILQFLVPALVVTGRYILSSVSVIVPELGTKD